MSLIKSALHRYKSLRFANEQVMHYKLTTIGIKGKRCKDFYMKLRNQVCATSPVIAKWSQSFNHDIDFSLVWKNKMKNQLEMKILEFNYKMLNFILPTRENLFKWKKIDDSLCFYCDNSTHNLKHLLWECKTIDSVWEIIGLVLSIDITWECIILGINHQSIYNSVISLICYVIYKKYITDGNNVSNRNISLQNLHLKRTYIETLRHVVIL